MPLITLDLPEATASRLLSMPESERNRYAVELFSEDEAEELPPLTPADLDALRRSRADMDAGRVRPVEQMMAEVHQEPGLAPRPFWNDRASVVPIRNWAM